MKFLLKLLDKTKPLFNKGGKLERLYPVFEAGENFMFTPDHTTRKAPHARDPLDLKRYMVTVIFALIPCVLAGMWNAGHQHNIANMKESGILLDFWRGMLIMLPVIIASYVFGGLWEVLFACARRHEINEGFLVTGLLFPLTLPPTIPLWQVALGISFGVVIGKEIFGGVGYNVLNPALTARAFLFFAHPNEITGNVWTAIGDKVADGFTSATPLAVAANTPAGTNILSALQDAGYSWWDMAAGAIPGCLGETSFIACIIGLAILLVTGVGSWRISLAGIAGLIAGSTLLNIFAAESGNPYMMLPFYHHLVMGGFAFGITFMATDPVSSAATPMGKLIYGFAIGFLTILIRVFNVAFVEGVMLVILFMNVMAPMIDHYVLQAHIRRRTLHA